jgi:hypothetical protein
MRPSAKLGLTALMAALLLASALTTASARNLEISNQRFRVTWSRLEFQSSVITLRCPVTLEGSFHSRTIPKVERLLIGGITRFDIKKDSCTNGRVLAEEEHLAWHVTYEGFTGTLPAISSARLLLSRFLFWIEVMTRRCIYGTRTDNITLSAAVNAGGEVTTLTPVAGRNVANLLEGPPGEFLGCPSTVTLSGEGTVTLLNSTTRIRIRLI